MNIDSGYPVRHNVPPGQERRACCGYINQGRGLSPLPQGNSGAQLSAQSRTLRIRQSYGLNFSSANSTSLLRAVAILLWVIFIRFRGPQALMFRPISSIDP
jgi:hypothetical protein